MSVVVDLLRVLGSVGLALQSLAISTLVPDPAPEPDAHSFLNVAAATTIQVPTGSQACSLLLRD